MALFKKNSQIKIVGVKSQKIKKDLFINNELDDKKQKYINQTIFQISKMDSNFENKKNNNPTIGFLINSFHSNYNFDIWKGINDALANSNCKLLSFVGASLNNPDFNNKYKNNIYNIPNINNIDGLLILSSSIGPYIKHSEMENFINSFEKIPKISIGTPIKNIPSLYIDNTKGFHDLMIHLIKDHKYKNIAFIHGPKKNKDAVDRFNTYKEVLNMHNIKLNPKLIIYGSYYANCGNEAIKKLLDERKADFDVIICSNDYVAINAVRELENRRIKIPHDIAVVGYDNISESKYLDHPLTTVNQPAYEIGYKAGRQMLSLIKGKKIPLIQKFESKVIIRKSCGCVNKDFLQKYKNFLSVCENKIIKNKSVNIEYIISLTLQVMKIIFHDIIKTRDMYYWAEILVMSLIRNLENNSIDIFLIKFREIITDPKLEKIDIYSWNSILYFIFIEITPKLTYDIITYNELFKKALEVIYSVAEQRLKKSIILTNELSRTFSLFKKKIRNTKDRKKIKEYLYRLLPFFGIKSIFIFCTNKHKWNNYKLLYGYKNGKKLDNKYFNLEYNQSDLIPDGIKKYKTNNTLLIFPAYNKHDANGFIIYEIDKKTMTSYDILGTQFNNVFEEITDEISTYIDEIIISLADKQQNNQKTKSQACEQKYRFLKLDEKKLDHYIQKIMNFMKKEKPYINSELSLPELSKMLEIPRNQLSYIINNYLNINFYDFINEFRVKEVKSYLHKTTVKKICYLEIAFESGFKSKSTFNKTFKKYTNMTPSKYRKKYLKKEFKT